MTITHINPDTMHKNPVFSQGMLVEGGKTLYVGEQNGVDANGAIVAGGAKAQAGEAWGGPPDGHHRVAGARDGSTGCRRRHRSHR